VGRRLSLRSPSDAPCGLNDLQYRCCQRLGPMIGPSRVIHALRSARGVYGLERCCAFWKSRCISLHRRISESLVDRMIPSPNTLAKAADLPELRRPLTMTIPPGQPPSTLWTNCCWSVSHPFSREKLSSMIERCSCSSFGQPARSGLEC